jgi:hypothetical protein
MNNQLTGRFPKEKRCTIRILKNMMAAALMVCLPFGAPQADTLWTPSVELSGTHNDNILFSRTAPEDDYIYTLEPALHLDLNRELTQVLANASIYLRRYQDNDELNDEIYNFDFKGKTNVTERFRMSGSYELIKDTTLDSELLEVGRLFIREDRLSQDARLAPRFNVTERMSIGLSGRYRNVAYDSDTNIDYSVWDVSMPIRWILITQIDTIYISPGYAFRDSDSNQSKTYNFRIGWDHETTERLNMKLSAGARYTEHEDQDTGSTDESWKGLGSLEFKYDFETGTLGVDFEHDLRNTADGDQVNVTSVHTRLRLNFTERTGTELNGRYIYTKNDRDVDAYSTDYYQVGAKLFYYLTENHLIFIAYDYSQDYDEHYDNDPRAERNRIWAGISLNFPMSSIF